MFVIIRGIQILTGEYIPTYYYSEHTKQQEKGQANALARYVKYIQNVLGQCEAKTHSLRDIE
jgi:hypothetical protein